MGRKESNQANKHRFYCRIYQGWSWSVQKLLEKTWHIGGSFQDRSWFLYKISLKILNSADCEKFTDFSKNNWLFKLDHFVIFYRGKDLLQVALGPAPSLSLVPPFMSQLTFYLRQRGISPNFTGSILPIPPLSVPPSASPLSLSLPLSPSLSLFLSLSQSLYLIRPFVSQLTFCLQQRGISPTSQDLFFLYLLLPPLSPIKPLNKARSLT